MSEENNYSGLPPSLAEARAARADDPRKWEVRDLLVSILRKLDSGELEAPDHLMLVYGSAQQDGSVSSGYVQAGNFNPFAQMGMLHSTIHSLLHP